LQNGAREQGQNRCERTLQRIILVLVLDHIIFKPETHNCQNLLETGMQRRAGRFDFSIAFCHGKKIYGHKRIAFSFIPIVIIMFRIKDVGISVVAKKCPAIGTFF
jgi:hypothetical protein